MHKYSNISFISLEQNLVKVLSLINIRSHIFPHTTGAALCNAHGQRDQIFGKVWDGLLQQ